MKTVKMPGFTAEAALIKGNVRFLTDVETAVYDGAVQPAFHQPGLHCLKFKYHCDRSGHCTVSTEVGMVNPITGRCE
jgi:hypothetical protein